MCVEAYCMLQIQCFLMSFMLVKFVYCFFNFLFTAIKKPTIKRQSSFSVPITIIYWLLAMPTLMKKQPNLPCSLSA